MGNKKIIYSDNFQKTYTYFLVEAEGKNCDPDFKPDLTPAQMLKLGVFGGAYFIGTKSLMPDDLPKKWFIGAELSKDNKKHSELNFFGVSASQSLAEWKQKGWIHKQDPHGWFEWYCRYYLGRRSDDDARQIKRWKAMSRHVAQVRANCRAHDVYCRARQRQALLHWAYDSRNI